MDGFIKTSKGVRVAMTTFWTIMLVVSAGLHLYYLYIRVREDKIQKYKEEMRRNHEMWDEYDETNFT